ncbi:polyhydroxyalkanoate synthase [Sphingomonas guangdongensis]|uniref:Polyhydroxyalkanoate synthase n=2 Tax=Sphingomonas guangdongensis TaxID=1141890 RepID=A0A285QA23_9SPHN|nr:polyhydroxyalkanoate synthase [Sphingomonas guangdongensis]
MLRSETATSHTRRAAALTGLRRYQQAPRVPPRDAGHVIARQGRVSLRDHGGSGRPVLVVPSLINPPAVLDLSEDRSLLRWLAAAGCRVLMVDWGAPHPDERDSDIDAHVTEALVPLIKSLDAPPVLVGYCLGGTLAIAAATLTPVAGVALLATPWRFGAYADARDGVARLWHAAEPSCAALGLVPVEVLQAGFWQLDPARTIDKYARLATADAPTLAQFTLLEDWANAGAPLTLAAGRQLFERFYAADEPGHGSWRIGGRLIDPAALGCPVLDIASATDRIVPVASRAAAGTQRTVAAGHVGMIVGSGARAAVWEPLADWISALRAPT